MSHSLMHAFTCYGIIIIISAVILYTFLSLFSCFSLLYSVLLLHSHKTFNMCCCVISFIPIRLLQSLVMPLQLHVYLNNYHILKYVLEITFNSHTFVTSGEHIIKSSYLDIAENAHLWASCEYFFFYKCFH
jgi:hypothetical protein